MQADHNLAESGDRHLACRKAARACGLAVVAIAVAVLTGWALDVPLLQSVLPGLPAMKANTALALALLGAALAGLATDGPRMGMARVAALLAATVGALTLAQTVLGCDLGVDQLLFHDVGSDGNPGPPGRPASETSVAVLLTGLALAVLDRGPSRIVTPAQALALPAGLVAAFFVLGYAFTVQGTSLVRAKTAMALHTSVALVALAAGTWLARPDRGPMALVTGDDLGARLARRVLPLASVLLLGLAWLRVRAEAHGLIATLPGVKVQMLASLLAITTVVLVATRRLTAADAARAIVQRDLQRALQTNELILQQMPDALTVVASDGSYRVFNDAAQRMMGHAPGGEPAAHYRQSLALFVEDGVTPLDLKDAPSLRALRGETVKDCILRVVRGDGTTVWCSVSASPLRDAQGRVEASVALARDITASRAAVEQLHTTNAALRHKTEEADAFVYAVSHDLRSPLVTIQGFCHELTLGVEDLSKALVAAHAPAPVPVQVRETLEKDIAGALFYIRAGTDRFEKLIGSLLALSRVGRRELRCDLLDMRALADATLAAARAKVVGSGAAITCSELPAAYGDATAVSQILANLLDNAMKYLQPGRPGQIVIGGERGDRDSQFWVQDNGLGIQEAGRERVFQVFQRLHPDAAPGDGVGLSMAKRLVERQGGRIWVDSAVGLGSTFHFTLPGRKPDRAAKEFPIVDQATN